MTARVSRLNLANALTVLRLLLVPVFAVLLLRDADAARYAHLLDPERIVGNLHRAYAEIEGGPPARPLDVIGIFGEMVQFNDGLLPTCLA